MYIGYPNGSMNALFIRYYLYQINALPDMKHYSSGHLFTEHLDWPDNFFTSSQHGVNLNKSNELYPAGDPLLFSGHSL